MEETPAVSPLPQENPDEEAPVEAVSPSPEAKLEPSPEPGQPSPQETRESIRQTATPVPGGLERVPTPAAPVVGEVPQELLAAVIDDAKQRQAGAAGKVEVVLAESVIWNDGSLGCPRPGIMYTQALVRGCWPDQMLGEELLDCSLPDKATDN